MYPYGLQDKKALNMLILEILEQYTDSDHPLTQMEIVDLLEKNYGVPCTRQTVKNNLMLLGEMGYEISMEGGICLMSRQFENAELRMLIDSVLFSRTLSGKQAKRLIEKLTGLGNKYFRAKVKHVCHLPKLIHSDNKQVLLNLDVLNDAIEQERKVRFTYNSYGKDFQLHPRRKDPVHREPVSDGGKSGQILFALQLRHKQSTFSLSPRLYDEAGDARCEGRADGSNGRFCPRLQSAKAHGRTHLYVQRSERASEDARL